MSIVGVMFSYGSDENWSDKIKKAVAGITAGSEQEQVLVGYEVLKQAADKGLPELLAELDNQQVVAIQLQESKTIRDPATGKKEHYLNQVGDIVFQIIQDHLEGDWPFRYGHLHVLKRNTIKAWLQERKEKSLTEIRAELARIALKQVREAYKDDSSREAQKTIQIFEERLGKINKNGSPDIITQ